MCVVSFSHVFLLSKKTIFCFRAVSYWRFSCGNMEILSVEEYQA